MFHWGNTGAKSNYFLLIESLGLVPNEIDIMPAKRTMLTCLSKLFHNLSMLARDFCGGNAGFDRASDSFKNRIPGIADVKILFGGECDVL